MKDVWYTVAERPVYDDGGSNGSRIGRLLPLSSLHDLREQGFKGVKSGRLLHAYPHDMTLVGIRSMSMRKTWICCAGCFPSDRRRRDKGHRVRQFLSLTRYSTLPWPPRLSYNPEPLGSAADRLQGPSRCCFCRPRKRHTQF